MATSTPSSPPADYYTQTKNLIHTILVDPDGGGGHFEADDVFFMPLKRYRDKHHRSQSQKRKENAKKVKAKANPKTKSKKTADDEGATDTLPEDISKLFLTKINRPGFYAAFSDPVAMMKMRLQPGAVIIEYVSDQSVVGAPERAGILVHGFTSFTYMEDDCSTLDPEEIPDIFSCHCMHECQEKSPRLVDLCRFAHAHVVDFPISRQMTDAFNDTENGCKNDEESSMMRQMVACDSCLDMWHVYCAIRCGLLDPCFPILDAASQATVDFLCPNCSNAQLWAEKNAPETTEDVKKRGGEGSLVGRKRNAAEMSGDDDSDDNSEGGNKRLKTDHDEHDDAGVDSDDTIVDDKLETVATMNVGVDIPEEYMPVFIGMMKISAEFGFGTASVVFCANGDDIGHDEEVSRAKQALFTLNLRDDATVLRHLHILKILDIYALEDIVPFTREQTRHDEGMGNTMRSEYAAERMGQTKFQIRLPNEGREYEDHVRAIYSKKRHESMCRDAFMLFDDELFQKHREAWFLDPSTKYGRPKKRGGGTQDATATSLATNSGLVVDLVHDENLKKALANFGFDIIRREHQQYIRRFLDSRLALKVYRHVPPFVFMDFAINRVLRANDESATTTAPNDPAEEPVTTTAAAATVPEPIPDATTVSARKRFVKYVKLSPDDDLNVGRGHTKLMLYEKLGRYSTEDPWEKLDGLYEKTALEGGKFAMMRVE
ncbi:hypothetical protein KDA14_02055 [Candidatus Saccharibacteria bacterium]|nr:hypothetical protein [Candidatus Saccharibacteria bacterium]